MGCYDTVYVGCPNCGHENEEQSKAGSCAMLEYSLQDAPKSILGYLDGVVIECERCHLSFEIVVDVHAYTKPHASDDDTLNMLFDPLAPF